MCQRRLILAQSYARRIDSIALGCIGDESAPSAPDIEESLARLEPKLAAYAKAIMGMPEMREWIDAALAEPADIEELEVEY